MGGSVLRRIFRQLFMSAAGRAIALIVGGLLWWVAAGALLLFTFRYLLDGGFGVFWNFPCNPIIGLIQVAGLLLAVCFCLCVGAVLLAEGVVPVKAARHD